jgi:hypothetical protein
MPTPGSFKLMLDAASGTYIEYDPSTGDIVLVRHNTERSRITSSGLATLVSSEARGDVLRRGASAWERLAAASSGRILVGDGTDIASVAVSGDVTLSSAGVTAIGAGKVLPSMVEADLIRYADVQLTNTQVLALNATPQTLVAAQGANKGILVHRIWMWLVASVAGYTNSGGGDAVVEFADGTDILTVTVAGFLDEVAATGRHQAPAVAVASLVANSAVRLLKATAEFGGGNAANSLSIRTWYSVVDMAAFS